MVKGIVPYFDKLQAMSRRHNRADVPRPDLTSRTCRLVVALVDVEDVKLKHPLTRWRVLSTSNMNKRGTVLSQLNVRKYVHIRRATRSLACNTCALPPSSHLTQASFDGDDSDDLGLSHLDNTTAIGAGSRKTGRATASPSDILALASMLGAAGDNDDNYDAIDNENAIMSPTISFKSRNTQVAAVSDVQQAIADQPRIVDDTGDGSTTGHLDNAEHGVPASVNHSFAAGSGRGAPAHRSRTPGRSILVGTIKGAGDTAGSTAPAAGVRRHHPRGAVAFGSPHVAEFHDGAPASLLTDVDNGAAKARLGRFDSGDGEEPATLPFVGSSSDNVPGSATASRAIPVSSADNIDDDGGGSVESVETSLNSSILQAWDDVVVSLVSL